jgi:signal recognition particle receptor subunit beta
MRIARLVIAAALTGSAASAARATTVVVFVEPMTFTHYTKVFDTPGRDRLLMCMAPPATGGCTEVPIKSRR